MPYFFYGTKLIHSPAASQISSEIQISQAVLQRRPARITPETGYRKLNPLLFSGNKKNDTKYR